MSPADIGYVHPDQQVSLQPVGDGVCSLQPALPRQEGTTMQGMVEDATQLGYGIKAVQGIMSSLERYNVVQLISEVPTSRF